MKKKVLYVTTIAGFLPQFEINDVRIMQQMGYEVHYATNLNNQVYAFDEKALTNIGIVLHHIDIRKKPIQIVKNIRAIKQIKKIIDEENITVVHCHNPMGAVDARIAAECSKVKPTVIYTAHGFHFYKGAPLKNWLLYYPVEKLLARYTDVIVTINKEDYMRAKSKFKLRQGGFIKQIHGVGVDIERFNTNSGIRERVRREIGIPQEAFHIVTAAELNNNKNQQVVIRAIARLNNSNIYYTLCGKGPNKDKLVRLINEYGLQDRVKLLGYRTDMEEILQTADLFAFPSQREGLGIAAVEALLCGVPVLASDNRGTREYVHNGINGVITSANSISEFADAIDRFYSDHVYRIHMAEQCRNTAIIFGLEESNRSMREIYEKVDERLS